jgi:threonyl-tRNA synthetase
MKDIKDQILLETKRHSLSHVMAAAVQKLWPKTKFAIGPAIDNGFYYDLDFDNAKNKNAKLRKCGIRIGENDLVKI